VVEFDQTNFERQCKELAKQIMVIPKNFEEPIDLEAFLDFYTKTKE
jgi:hypothetical protein